MEDFELWKQGAEARIYTGKFALSDVCIKERFVKKYRHTKLDDILSKERLKNEARGILRCKAAGVKCPILYNVDLDDRLIYIEKLNGITVKKYLDTNTQIDQIAFLIGENIAKIHSNNLIHGDLTTSNMILVSNQLYLIDFGLSSVSSSCEDKAVDLYVLERAILSTHDIHENFFINILNTYKKTNKNSKEILKKYEEVKTRGRKRTMIG